MDVPATSPSEHAILSPSASERWISCPASVLATVDIKKRDPSNSYAEEGTAFHALCFIEATKHLLDGDAEEHAAELAAWREMYGEVFDTSAMWGHVPTYIALLKEALEDAGPGAYLLLEQRVNTGVPGSWGTADAIVVGSTVVHIVDIKYGQGIKVSPFNNPQFRLYALGALEEYDFFDAIQDVKMTVYQPRLHNTVTAEMSKTELMVWKDKLLPIAAAALKPGAPFGPSEDACRWCPLSGNCAAQLKYFTEMDFGTEPSELTNVELANALEMIPAVQDWINAIHAHAMKLMYEEGATLPGFKVVQSSGKRFVKPEAADALEVLGYDREEYGNWKIKGIGDLTKLVGRAVFNTSIAPYLGKSSGKPVITKADDPRSPIDKNSSAARDFENLDEDEGDD